jgi:hypothetical protein
VEIQIIQNKIIEIRGHKIMLDFHLAELYEVETRTLKQAVRRNMERFPSDFLFVLTEKEIDFMVSQNVIPSKSYFGGAIPFAFTEQGVAMLSSVLKSKKAIAVNISIMRAFALLRQHLSNYKNLKESIEALEKEMNIKFKDIYEALNFLLENPKPERKPMGYKPNN